MTDLRTAAQQALEALVRASSYYDTYAEISALEAALAEHDKNLAWFKERKANWDLQRKLAEETQERDRLRQEEALQRFTDVNQEIEAAITEPPTDWEAVAADQAMTIALLKAEPVQEPPCATRECMPSQCPNCVSLQDQNTELDRKLADLEQTSLELCNVCGWKTLIPGDCCLICERKHPLGQASTDVPLTVYSVKKAEPVQEPVAWMDIDENGNRLTVRQWSDGNKEEVPLYTHPPQRKPPATIDEMFDRMDKAPKGVFFGHDPMTIWMEAWRAAEQHHGVKKAHEP